MSVALDACGSCATDRPWESRASAVHCQGTDSLGIRFRPAADRTRRASSLRQFIGAKCISRPALHQLDTPPFARLLLAFLAHSRSGGQWHDSAGTQKPDGVSVNLVIVYHKVQKRVRRLSRSAFLAGRENASEPINLLLIQQGVRAETGIAPSDVYSIEKKHEADHEDNGKQRKGMGHQFAPVL
jgi:hypothetical protein